MFKITKETPLKNGDVNWEFTVTNEFKDLAKIKYGKSRYTENLGKRLIVDAIYNGMLVDLEKGLKNALKLNGLK